MKLAAVYLCLLLLLFSCGGEIIPDDPVRQMRRKFEPGKAHTIILADMDLQGDVYKHRYKLFHIAGDGSVSVKETGWKTVSDEFFALHQDDLGMEVLSQNKQGKINNLVTPPGFTNIIGDTLYGSWVPGIPDTVSGTVTPEVNEEWRFKNKYRWLARELGVEGMRITLPEYRVFQQLYRYNRPFYGEKILDSTHYGTHSPHMHHMYPYFYTRMRYRNNFVKPHGVSYHGTGRGGGGFGK